MSAHGLHPMKDKKERVFVLLLLLEVYIMILNIITVTSIIKLDDYTSNHYWFYFLSLILLLLLHLKVLGGHTGHKVIKENSQTCTCCYPCLGVQEHFLVQEH